MIQQRHFAYVLAAMLAVVIATVYSETFVSMVTTWSESSTFVHGFLIIPMAAYVVWERRDQLSGLEPRPAWQGLVVMAAALMVWIGSGFAFVQVGQQLAVIGLLQGGVWAILGTRIARMIGFALFFLVFAVPFGEFLVPKLMEWTSIMVVSTVSLLGIPVLLEGNYFALPSGNFKVAEACSGLRFLLVTVVLSTYLSHFIYAGWRKRIVFIGVAALVMIVANAVRAFVIVLVAHLSEMQASLVWEHDYLGWLVFVTAIALTFWAGNKYADHHFTPHGQAGAGGAAHKQTHTTVSSLVMTQVIALIILFSGPVVSDAHEARVLAPRSAPQLPLADDGWAGPYFSSGHAAPAFSDATYVIATAYKAEGETVELHVAFYDKQRQGSELIGAENSLYDPDRWRLAWTGDTDSAAPESNQAAHAGAIGVTNGKQRMLIWHWYDLDGFTTSYGSLAKFVSAWNAVSGKRRGEALVLIATHVDDNNWGEAGTRLGAFLKQHGEAVAACLRPDSAAVDGCVRRPRRQVQKPQGER